MKKTKTKTVEQRRAEVSVTLESLGPTDPIMIGAWIGAIHWGISDPDMLSQFKDETGLAYSPPRSGIERMIDESTGIQGEFILAFARWFNRQHWGEVDDHACDGSESFNLSDDEIAENWGDK